MRIVHITEHPPQTSIKSLQTFCDAIACERMKAADYSKESENDPTVIYYRPTVAVLGIEFRPIFFYDGGWICALGSNPHSGAWGAGDTPYEALEYLKEEVRARLTPDFKHLTTRGGFDSYSETKLVED